MPACSASRPHHFLPRLIGKDGGVKSSKVAQLVGPQPAFPRHPFRVALNLHDEFVWVGGGEDVAIADACEDALYPLLLRGESAAS